MRYRLRTLLIILAIGPPMLAVAWFGVTATISRYLSPYGNTAPYGNYIKSEKDILAADSFDKLIKEIQEYEPNPEFSKMDGLELITGESDAQPDQKSHP